MWAQSSSPSWYMLCYVLGWVLLPLGQNTDMSHVTGNSTNAILPPIFLSSPYLPLVSLYISDSHQFCYYGDPKALHSKKDGNWVRTREQDNVQEEK